MARKMFAVVNVVDDCLHTMESAEAAVALEGMYPPGAFLIVDMDGKGDVPFKPGASMRDLTIDPATGEWVWKLTDLQIANRVMAERQTLLRNRVLGLMLAHELALTLDPTYGPVAGSLQARIMEIQSEIAPM